MSNNITSADGRRKSGNNAPAEAFQASYKYAFDTPDFPLAIKPMFSRQATDIHYHEQFYEIVLVISGKGEHFCEQHRYPLQIGEIFVILPGMRHGYSQCENLEYFNILADFKNLALPLYDLPSTPGYQDLFVIGPRSHFFTDAPPLRNILDIKRLDQSAAIIRNMLSLQSRQLPGYQQAMTAQLAEFLRIVCRAGEDWKSLPALQDKDIPVQIADIADAISRNCHRHWDVEQISKAFRISRPVLFREFKKYFNTTPGHYITIRRLHKAMALLSNSDMNLEEIAIQCGFANGSYFSTVFSKYLHQTPLQFRRDPHSRDIKSLQHDAD